MTDRLPWERSSTGDFEAFPEGRERPGCRALVRYAGHHSEGYRWAWTVGWTKWFSADGLAATKQDAADAATEAWWRLKQTPVPRDIEGEIEAIVDTLLTRPPPSDLLSEDGEYLRRLMMVIRMKWERDLRNECAPRQVMDLIAAMSEELYVRRVTSGRTF